MNTIKREEMRNLLSHFKHGAGYNWLSDSGKKEIDEVLESLMPREIEEAEN